MKNILKILLILTFVGCGIDKQPAPPVSTLAGGDLDDSFASSGSFTHGNAAGGNLNDEGYSIAVDGLGRIVIVGSSTNAAGNADVAVWRLTANGALDVTFSGDGIFTLNDIAGGDDEDIAFGVAINGSNEIFVTGYSKNALNNFDMFVFKLTAAGSLDTNFNGTGVFVDDGAAGGFVHDQGNAIVIDNSGNLFVTGYSDKTPSNRDMALWKISATGSLVNAFSTDGIVTHDGAAGGEDDVGHSLTLDASGNIYVVGNSQSTSNSNDMVVWKFDSSGNLATSFSGDGIFTHNNAAGGNGFDAGTGIAIDSIGSIYVSGYSRNAANNNDMVVWKLKTDGTLNTGFNSTGIFVFNITVAIGFPTSDAGEAIAIDSEDNIIIGGSGNSDVAAWRLTSEGVLDDGFNGDGVFFHDSAAGGFAADAGKGMFMDVENEELYITGYSENSSGNFDMAVWKLK